MFKIYVKIFFDNESMFYIGWGNIVKLFYLVI